ncbi:FAD binding domain-containing protein [Roseomonas marmotae]|uniref:Xanthine dehydrogenase family protein subunit M n=1 Tax=Roseomonas marmotae TaxID=2768161 RepID=A0ABS3KF33_9PROT|nr:xanthine dehydrogenase family protein subunit M [Roseomonas marmotae]MBO1076079.1 xanthine dehydrogenase family protein subunit M [Roseomonas marmotae]QTI81318.1 xanthine dehydrogenase family protein subunit M [Roseomonas marmotae]
MNRFSYSRPQDVAEALRAIGADGKFIAGGTNLVDLMKYDVERPRQLVDIARIPGLDRIEALPEGGLRIGALVTNSALAYAEEVQRDYPLLSRAILSGASPQLRNAATTGGNLLQRTRCYYFYDAATPCNKREPGTGCPARTGVNRIHAILGASEHCIATHPSDMAVALAALEARVRVAGPGGERVIPMAEFHRLPGDRPEIDTTLARDEIITAVELPEARFPRHYTYLKLRDRQSYAFALVSVAVGLEMEGETIRRARIALGGVAHRPWRVPEAEALLADQTAGREAFAEAAARLLHGARGHGHNDFKIELARRAIERALAQAAAGRPQGLADKRIA